MALVPTTSGDNGFLYSVTACGTEHMTEQVTVIESPAVITVSVADVVVRTTPSQSVSPHNPMFVYQFKIQSVVHAIALINMKKLNFAVTKTMCNIPICFINLHRTVIPSRRSDCVLPLG